MSFCFHYKYNQQKQCENETEEEKRSAVEPVMLTFRVVTEFFWLEPQVDLGVGTFYRITAMDDVPVVKANEH